MIEKEFDAKIEELTLVNEFVEQFLDEAECSMKAQMQIMISLEEIFVNIAHYAYADLGGEGTVKIGLSLQDDRILSLRFVDSGLPFNPLEQDNPDTNAKAEDRQIGGLGIFMVRKNMDHMHYEYNEGYNILTLQKKI